MIYSFNVYTVFKFGSRSLSSWHWHAPSHGFGRFGRCLGLQTDVEKHCFSQENHLQVGFPNLSFQEGSLLTGRNCLWKRWHLGIVQWHQNPPCLSPASFNHRIAACEKTLHRPRPKKTKEHENTISIRQSKCVKVTCQVHFYSFLWHCTWQHLSRIFLFSHGLRGFWVKKCQETVADVRNILYLYNNLKSVLLKHVEAMSQLHAAGLHFQRWEASTTSLKV